ncbi:polyprenyl synthetase family protein [Desulfosarcina ovata]|nr:polyprenyl synthetase family protein [Desulfosarcina ovata]
MPEMNRGHHHATFLAKAPPLQTLLAELKQGLEQYWTVADQILRPAGVALEPPGRESFAWQKNFFSLLFLYSYQRAGIPSRRRILYAATLQCLRGMVTGCDNLLDDEYKATLETDLPPGGYRFRSVVDIMVSDRVLFQILMDAAGKGDIPIDRVTDAAAASMRTMTRSGRQEAGEEAGIDTILAPDVILESIHHYKTGILFQCPWDIPLTFETITENRLAPLLEGLYRIGMGCQIMDDMVDLAIDVEKRRHNYLVSLIYHDGHAAEKDRLNRIMRTKPASLHASHFPEALHQAATRARLLLEQGLGTLFWPQHRKLIPPAIRFLEKRIGMSALMNEASG